jgi:hypothetical protein
LNRRRGGTRQRLTVGHSEKQVRFLPDSFLASGFKREITMDIETRVTLTLAIRRYLRAAERFEEAQKEFSESCANIRFVIRESPIRAAVNIDHKMMIFECDTEKNFSVEPIDLL